MLLQSRFRKPVTSSGCEVTPKGYRISKLSGATSPRGSPESVLGPKDVDPPTPPPTAVPQRLDEGADSDPETGWATRILEAIPEQPAGETEEGVMAAVARPQQGLHSPKATILSRLPRHP